MNESFLLQHLDLEGSETVKEGKRGQDRIKLNNPLSPPPKINPFHSTHVVSFFFCTRLHPTLMAPPRPL